MMKFPAVLAFCVFFFPAALAAQIRPAQGSRPSQNPALPVPRTDTPAAETAVLSLYDVLEAAEGAHLVWRPDWPVDLPPDLFYVDESAGSAVSVKAEWEDGGGLECVFQNGRFAAFPVFMGGMLFQGRAEYNRDGRLQKFSWSAGGDEPSDAEALEWDGQGRPVLLRVFGGDYVFAALEYAGRRVIETWYDRDGAALYGLIHEDGVRALIPAAPPAGETASAEAAPPRTPESGGPDPVFTGSGETRYFYTNEGRLSGVESPDGTAAALYTIRGMPRYLERSGGTALESAGASAAPRPVPEAYTWQWDEAGRLVRLSAVPVKTGTADNPLDYRYEYTLDSRGNWTERREFALGPLGSSEEGVRLVPRTVRVVRRIIRYEAARNSPGERAK